MEKKILDYDEYYSDAEQRIYDHGYRDGYWWGQFWMLIAEIVVAVATYLLIK